MAKTKQELKEKIDYLQDELNIAAGDYLDLSEAHEALSSSYDALSLLYRKAHAKLESISATALDLIKEIAQ